MSAYSTSRVLSGPFATYVAGGYFATGTVPRRHGSAHPTIAPYQGFPTADGNLMLAVGNENLWRRFVRAAGLDHLANDPRFALNAGRVQNRDELVALLSDRLSTRPTADWVALFDDAGVPVGPISTIDEVMVDPQILAREMILEVEHPTAGMVNNARLPDSYVGEPGIAPPSSAAAGRAHG